MVFVWQISQRILAKSTISIFLKNKEVIKADDVAKGIAIVHSKQWPQIMDEVVKLLLIWIKGKELDGGSISEGIICEKALHSYGNDLSSDEDEGRESFPSFLIKEMYAKFWKVQIFVLKFHSDTMLANKAVHIFNDNSMIHFGKILQRR